MRLFKQNNEIYLPIYKHHRCENDGWYYIPKGKEAPYEPIEYPETELVELRIELEEGEELLPYEKVKIEGVFLDYHPNLGTFSVNGVWDMVVKCKIGQTYFLESDN